MEDVTLAWWLRAIKPYMQAVGDKIAVMIGDSREADAIMAKLPELLRKAFGEGLRIAGSVIQPFKAEMFGGGAKGEAVAHLLNDVFDTFTNKLGQRLGVVEVTDEEIKKTAGEAFDEVISKRFGGKKRLSIADIRSERPDLYAALEARVALLFTPEERQRVWDQILLYMDVPDLEHLAEVEAAANAATKEEFLRALLLMREKSFLTVFGAMFRQFQEAVGGRPPPQAGGAPQTGAQPQPATSSWQRGVKAADDLLDSVFKW